MTVKARVGRRRYLLLRFAPPVSRHRLARLLEARLSPLGGAVLWRLLRCDGGEAVVRVDHRVAHEARAALNGPLGEGVVGETVVTSGTVKGLARRLAER